MKNFLIALTLTLLSHYAFPQAERELKSGVVNLKQQSSAPASPTSGRFKAYIRDSKLRLKNSSGTESTVGSGEGGGFELLADGSFESGVSEGTCSGCTATNPAAGLLTTNNLKQLNMAFSASTGSYRTVILTGAEFAGVRFSVSCHIKTTLAGIRLYSRVNGANSLYADNRDVINDGVWREYTVQSDIMGTTSVGYGVEATSSVTGNVSVERCSVKIPNADAIPEIGQAQLAGSSYFAPTASCTWTRTNAAFGAPATVAACPGPTINSQSVGTWATTDTDLPAQTITAAPAGRYVVYAKGSLSNGTTGQFACMAISDGTTTGQGECVSNTDVANIIPTMPVLDITYPSVGDRTFTVHLKSNSGAATLTQTANGSGLQFIIYYYPPQSSIISSANKDTDWVDCGLTTSDFNGFGTVTSIEDLCKKDGSDLIMNVKFTAGTTTASEARVNLKLLGTALTSANSTITPSVKQVGAYTLSSTGANYYTTLIEASVGYVTFGFHNGSSAGLTKRNGSDIFSSGNALSFYARVPINGWSSSPFIIGTFKEMMQVPGIDKPKRCHYMYGGSGTTLAVPVECTTGSCTEQYDSCSSATPPTRSSTGGYTDLTFANGTWAASTPLLCNCVAYDTTNTQERECNVTFFTGDNTWSTNASGGAVLNLITVSPAGAAGDAYVSLSCEGSAP